LGAQAAAGGLFQGGDERVVAEGQSVSRGMAQGIV